MESEFIAMSSAGEEADWLRSMLIDIPLWSKSISPLTIYCDNQTAIFRLQVISTIASRDKFVSNIIMSGDYWRKA